MVLVAKPILNYACPLRATAAPMVPLTAYPKAVPKTRSMVGSIIVPVIVRTIGVVRVITHVNRVPMAIPLGACPMPPNSQFKQRRPTLFHVMYQSGHNHIEVHLNS